MSKYEYIIVGDAVICGEKSECLVTICGNHKKDADARLKQMLTDPDDIDKHLMRGHTNFRIKKVVSAECWWNDPVMRN